MLSKTYEDGRREGYETALARLIEVAEVTERRETPVLKAAASIVRLMGHDFGVRPGVQRQQSEKCCGRADETEAAARHARSHTDSPQPAWAGDSDRP